MIKTNDNPFSDYFHIQEAEVDPGLLKIENGVPHPLPKAFFDYQHAVDTANGFEVAVESFGRGKCVTLPSSVRNRSKVLFVGKPVFASLDGHNNLLTYLTPGCVVRVEYLGKKEERKKVKFFKYV